MCPDYLDKHILDLDMSQLAQSMRFGHWNIAANGQFLHGDADYSMIALGSFSDQGWCAFEVFELDLDVRAKDERTRGPLLRRTQALIINANQLGQAGTTGRNNVSKPRSENT